MGFESSRAARTGSYPLSGFRPWRICIDAADRRFVQPLRTQVEAPRSVRERREIVPVGKRQTSGLPGSVAAFFAGVGRGP